MPVNLPKSNWLRKSNNIHYVLATHSSTLAWKIPWAEEPGRLQSMGSLRVGHDWATSLSLFTFMHWRRKWQPTPLFLPGESQGWEPRGLPSMGSHRVGHDWSDLAAAAAIFPAEECSKSPWPLSSSFSLTAKWKSYLPFQSSDDPVQSYPEDTLMYRTLKLNPKVQCWTFPHCKFLTC